MFMVYIVDMKHHVTPPPPHRHQPHGYFCLQTILSLWRTKQGYCIARSVPPILFSALSLPTRPSPSRACVTRGIRSTCSDPNAPQQQISKHNRFV